MRNKEIIKKTETTRAIILTIRMRQLQFLGRIIRKERLKNLTFTCRALQIKK